jgi:GAF domain-containing protein
MTEANNTNFEGVSTLLATLSDNATQLANAVNQLVADAQRQQIQPAQNIVDQSETLTNEIETAVQTGLETINQVQHLRVLVNTASMITASLDLDEVVGQVLSTALQITQSTHAYLLLNEPSRSEFTLQAWQGWQSEADVRSRMKTHQPAVDHTLKAGEPFSAAIDASGSVRCIPLIIRQQTIGMIVTDHAPDDDLSEGIKAILAAFGNQAAIAIQNARLFAQVKAELELAREQAQRLKIQIDESRTNSQIDEIANSDFFRRLQEVRQNDSD